MEKEFLQKVNIDALQKETGLTIKGIAELAGVSVQTVYRWAWEKSRQGNRPSYNAFVRLIEHGASCRTLFGVEAKDAGVTEDKDFIAGVRLALAQIAKESADA